MTFTRKRLHELFDFVVAQLPSTPTRVLEIGCGDGELALALAGAGHEVTAIDPQAPEGPTFHNTTLEDFASDTRFDAVVASVSLHHITDVELGVNKVADLLRPGGFLVLEEFARERFSGATARWYFHQRQALAAAGVEDMPEPDRFEAWLDRWAQEHTDVHPFSELRKHITRRFEERHFSWIPYLYDYRLADALEPLERELINSGAIDATGLRYVGELRDRPGSQASSLDSMRLSGINHMRATIT